MHARDLILAKETNTCLVFTKNHATCIHDYQLNRFDLLIILISDQELIGWHKGELAFKFDMKDIGLMYYFLSCGQVQESLHIVSCVHLEFTLSRHSFYQHMGKKLDKKMNE